MIYLSDDICIRLSIYPMIYLSDDLSVRLSIYPMCGKVRVRVRVAELASAVLCCMKRLFCGEFGLVRFLVVCFLYKTIPIPRKVRAVGKSGTKCHFSIYFFFGWVGLGLGSSSVSW